MTFEPGDGPRDEPHARCRPAADGKGSHDVLVCRDEDQRDDGERNSEAEDYLAEDKGCEPAQGATRPPSGMRWAMP